MLLKPLNQIRQIDQTGDTGRFIITDDNNVQFIVILFNQVYQTGVLPDDLLKSVFISRPKKSNTNLFLKCTFTSLMRQLLKVFFRIIYG